MNKTKHFSFIMENVVILGDPPLFFNSMYTVNPNNIESRYLLDYSWKRVGALICPTLLQLESIYLIYENRWLEGLV